MNVEREEREGTQEFDWVGLTALLIGVMVPLYALYDLSIYGIVLKLLVFGPIVAMIVFIRRYNWKNIAAAFLLVCTIYPVRIIFHWWINPIIFGIASVVCLLLLIRVKQHHSWKHGVTVLLITCTLLTGWQTLLSAVEIDHCFIDDIRWTRLFYCETTGGRYQQIEQLPIGMQGYCYYCPWYEGVGGW